jgi:hypothetical protein
MQSTSETDFSHSTRSRHEASDFSLAQQQAGASPAGWPLLLVIGYLKA